MEIEKTYKAATIKPGDTEETKYCAILSRVSTYLSVSGQTILSAETQKTILGDDKYMRLSLDAVAYFVKGYTTEELEKFIKFHLSKMVKLSESIPTLDEIRRLIQTTHQHDKLWRECEKAYNSSKPSEWVIGDQSLFDRTLKAYNYYDDAVDKLKKAVNKVLESGSTIEVVFKNGGSHSAILGLEDAILFWVNGTQMRYVDDRNYWRGFDWATVIGVSITELSTVEQESTNVQG